MVLRHRAIGWLLLAIALGAAVILPEVALTAEPRPSWSQGQWKDWSESQKVFFAAGFYHGWVTLSTAINDILEGRELDKCVQSLSLSPKELVAIVDKHLSTPRLNDNVTLDVVFFFALSQRCKITK